MDEFNREWQEFWNPGHQPETEKEDEEKENEGDSRTHFHVAPSSLIGTDGIDGRAGKDRWY